MLSHLVQLALKVDDGPYSIRLPVAVHLYRRELRRRIKLEHFQVKVVNIGGPHAATARDPMRVSQSAAIDDGNTPCGWLVEDIVGAKVQEHVASLKERLLQVEQLLVDGERRDGGWL